LIKFLVHNQFSKLSNIILIKFQTNILVDIKVRWRL
jgi:hypothetical protein